jgi:hypothetical protein
MVEGLLIGFLLATLLMTPVFPKRKTFYKWIYEAIKRGQTR